VRFEADMNDKFGVIGTKLTILRNTNFNLIVYSLFATKTHYS